MRACGLHASRRRDAVARADGVGERIKMAATKYRALLLLMSYPVTLVLVPPSFLNKITHLQNTKKDLSELCLANRPKVGVACREMWTRIWDGTPILSASADTANALGDTVKMWGRGRAQ